MTFWFYQNQTNQWLRTLRCSAPRRGRPPLRPRHWFDFFFMVPIILCSPTTITKITPYLNNYARVFYENHHSDIEKYLNGNLTITS